jgi:DNA-binding transcriptional ArsR family regulator
MVKIALEVKRALRALQDDTRLEILLKLSEKEDMSFSQIQDLMKLPSPNVTYHLQALQEGALIENFFKKVEDVDSHSFYRVTEFGERILDSLFRVLTPGPILVEYRRTHEREVMVKEKWTEEVRYTKLPASVRADKPTYVNIVLEEAKPNE